jgi:hypothetical protein
MTHDRIPDRGTVPLKHPEIRSDLPVPQRIATRDHAVIRAWATRHAAEPATGEASESGPATLAVNDGGAGLRFNFPGVGRFRPITWDEWLAHFDRHDLVFECEEDVAHRAYELAQRRGATQGHDLDDWLEAERQLGRPARGASATYALTRNAREE